MRRLRRICTAVGSEFKKPSPPSRFDPPQTEECNSCHVVRPSRVRWTTCEISLVSRSWSSITVQASLLTPVAECHGGYGGRSTLGAQRIHGEGEGVPRHLRL